MYATFIIHGAVVSSGNKKLNRDTIILPVIYTYEYIYIYTSVCVFVGIPV
jgi:hypothetical protein